MRGYPRPVDMMRSQYTARPHLPAARGPVAAPYGLIALLTVGLMLFYTSPMCPDVSGQFWIAQMMRHGVRLYVDFIEMNPPLWFWMAVPIDWAAEVSGIRYEYLVIAAVALAIAAAVRAIDRLLPFGRLPKAMFLLFVVAVLMIMPARDFEQREHLALIAGLPYFILAAARRDGRPVTPRLAGLIGIFAGIGLSLKPHFFAGPMLIELWLLTSLRRDWRPLRAETLAMAAIVSLYLAAIALCTPAYLTYILPELLGPYQAISPPLGEVMGSFTPFLWLVMLIAFLPLRRALLDRSAPVTTALLLGGVGFALAWMLQHKGWFYQGLPATGCFALAFATLLIENSFERHPLFKVFIPCLLCLPLATAMLDSEPAITPDNDIAPALADLRSGDAFALISASGAASWPALVDRGLRLSSRYGQYWMIRLLDSPPHDPAAVRLADRAIRDSASDFRCLPPKVIVVVRSLKHRAGGPVDANPLPYFMRDPQFAAVMAHYRLARSGRIYDSYGLAIPFAAFDRSACRRSP